MDARDEHYPTYYVQSPSSLFQDPGSEFQSPTRPDTTPLVLAAEKTVVDVDDFPRYSVLSRYSDNNSFCDDKAGGNMVVVKGRVVVVHGGDSTADEWSSGGGGRRWWRYLTFKSSDSGYWIAMQMCWRFVFSLGVALLVFYIATQPPPPSFSLEVGRVSEFILGEGVDSHGVTTKILSCNCSIKLIVENKSKVFGLHIHPPSMEISFGHIAFAKSRGPKLYAETRDSTSFRLNVGTKNRPMYGAGREMDEMLKSSRGLALTLRMDLVSDFRVVWKIINPNFRHRAECLLLLGYDERHKQGSVRSKVCRSVSVS
ncbi:PREDICTED: uncharacterized protein LOC104819073 [Tarenaya hassleriana]|uniref:uncharacterized protein LOC104819073 n=1 Tax=Tarenaya hassleriana TaxID=28532 RepID=UPI00053C37C1|nr:PREDICTED: uncharacterized protein LOC104819073 [Tarenaya hassleriana]